MRERERDGNKWMIWLLMWLNKSITTINTTLQFIYIYIYRERERERERRNLSQIKVEEHTMRINKRELIILFLHLHIFLTITLFFLLRKLETRDRLWLNANCGQSFYKSNEIFVPIEHAGPHILRANPKVFSPSSQNFMAS